MRLQTSRLQLWAWGIPELRPVWETHAESTKPVIWPLPCCNRRKGTLGYCVQGNRFCSYSIFPLCAPAARDFGLQCSGVSFLFILYLSSPCPGLPLTLSSPPSFSSAYLPSPLSPLPLSLCAPSSFLRFSLYPPSWWWQNKLTYCACQQHLAGHAHTLHAGYCSAAWVISSCEGRAVNVLSSSKDLGIGQPVWRVL